MKVSEIFLSVQGEGRRTGVVSVFIRLAGCDLRCRWCDTRYAFNSERAESLSLEEIIDRVEKYDCGQVVVTGGEPLISPELPKLLEELKKQDKYITLETNATRFYPITCDLVSISPKLGNSTPREGSYAQIAQTHEKARLNELTSTRDLTWEAYQALAEKETEVRNNLQTSSSVNLASPAVPPVEPASRGVLRNTLIGAAVGMFLSLVWVLGSVWLASLEEPGVDQQQA